MNSFANGLRQRPLVLVLGWAGLLTALAALPRVRAEQGLLLAFVGAAAGLCAWAAWLALRSRQVNRQLNLEWVAPLRAHYIQGCVQLSIYAYWAAYWPKVAEAWPLILGQMLFLSGFDGLLQLSRGRSWRVGLGPVPIIFSTNLFMWFKDDWFAWQFVMIATCALAKEFLRWERDGKNTHIFNPSAFGLALCSLVLIVTQSTHITWGIEVANTIGLPPYMHVWIFVVGLVVQYFFAVTLMTASAVLTLVLLNWAYTQVTGVYLFVDTNIPIAIFLGLHLLVTDPATSPRTPLGRILFGALYGAANFALFPILGGLNIPDFYDKLLPVPLLNLSVKALDGLVRHPALARMHGLVSLANPQRANRVHMAAWVALFSLLVSTGFMGREHPGSTAHFWWQAYREGKPAAGRNWMKMVGTRAEAGNAAACHQMGLIYIEGQIVPQNRGLAAHYFARSCELGYPAGCESVAWQFLTLGEALSKPALEQALDSLEQRWRDAVDGRAGLLLGRAYETGQGRPQDSIRALEAYSASASVGNLDALRSIGRMWRAQQGGREELMRLRPILEQAAAAQHDFARELLEALRRDPAPVR